MSEIVIYQTENGHIQIDVSLANETLWLSQQQMSALFGVQRQAITKHLKNIFQVNELQESAVCSIMEHTAQDGKTYKTKHYNLDAVISVGYRVNSSQATQFRIWATRILKEHLIRGYTLNDKRLGGACFTRGRKQSFSKRFNDQADGQFVSRLGVLSEPLQR